MKKSSDIKHSSKKEAEKKPQQSLEKIKDNRTENEDKKGVSKIVKKSITPKQNQGPKKDFAIVNGRNLPLSLKHSIAICNYIRGNSIDNALIKLEEVKKMKKAIPMRGDIPHKSGMMSGRYPVKAVTEFIALLKSLKANALINEMELEKYSLFCMPNGAPRPYRRFGQHRFKRCHVQLKLIPIENKNK